MKRKISAAIITKNEEKNIRRCLDALHWVDEIVIVDSGSQDSTLQICKEYKCKIIETSWLGFGKTKKLAAESTRNDWVLSIDADEEVTPELAEEIKSVLNRPNVDSGYRIRWRSFYVERWINYSGWSHSYKLKLFDKTKGNFNDDDIHERVILRGECKNLSQPLLHYTYPTISSHIHKMDTYSDLGAQKMYAAGKRITLPGTVIRGGFKFLKMFFLQRGFLDGKIGLVLALNSAYGVYLKYLKLWKLRR